MNRSLGALIGITLIALASLKAWSWGDHDTPTSVAGDLYYVMVVVAGVLEALIGLALVAGIRPPMAAKAACGLGVTFVIWQAIAGPGAESCACFGAIRANYVTRLAIAGGVTVTSAILAYRLSEPEQAEQALVG